VDERILRAQVSSDHILLEVSPWDEAQSSAELEAKVQRVVLSMAKGAFKPKLQILEDHLDRPVSFHQDPCLSCSGAARSVRRRMVSIPWTVADPPDRFFRGAVPSLAASFGAAPYRFPR